MTTNTLSPKKIPYLTNKDLLPAVVEAKQYGRLTDKLAAMLQLLCARYATKGNFAGYTYNDDMQAYAMLMLVRTWNSFDLDKSKNPFAFFTQCIKNSFKQYLNTEKRQRNVRDRLLVKQGMHPSFAFQEDQSDQHYVEDEQDYYFHYETAISLQKALVEDEEITLSESIDNISEDDVDEFDTSDDDTIED